MKEIKTTREHPTMGKVEVILVCFGVINCEKTGEGSLICDGKYRERFFEL